MAEVFAEVPAESKIGSLCKMVMSGRGGELRSLGGSLFAVVRDQSCVFGRQARDKVDLIASPQLL